MMVPTQSHSESKRTASPAAKKRSSKPSQHEMVSEPVTTLSTAELTRSPHRADDRYSLIAEAAYHGAEQRGFVPGYELDDWLAAEADVDARLASEGRVY